MKGRCLKAAKRAGKGKELASRTFSSGSSFPRLRIYRERDPPGLWRGKPRPGQGGRPISSGYPNRRTQPGVSVTPSRGSTGHSACSAFAARRSISRRTPSRRRSGSTAMPLPAGKSRSWRICASRSSGGLCTPRWMHGRSRSRGLPGAEPSPETSPVSGKLRLKLSLQMPRLS